MEENIVGKGENVGYQHFLIFPQYFQKLNSAGSGKQGIVWKRVNSLPNNKILDLSESRFVADNSSYMAKNFQHCLLTH